MLTGLETGGRYSGLRYWLAEVSILSLVHMWTGQEEIQGPNRERYHKHMANQVANIDTKSGTNHQAFQF